MYHGVGATDNPWSGNVNCHAVWTCSHHAPQAAVSRSWGYLVVFPRGRGRCGVVAELPPPPPPPPASSNLPFFCQSPSLMLRTFKKYCGRTFQFSASSFRPQSAKRSTPAFFFFRGMDTGVTIFSSFIFFCFLCNNNLYDSNSQQ